ncbi:MAG: hypothetical protein ACE5DK_09005 [Paracoccaceae bacterium]
MKLVLATLAATLFVASTASASIFGAFTAREIAEGSVGNLNTGYKSSRTSVRFSDARDMVTNGGALRKYTFKGNPSRLTGYSDTSMR